MRLEQFWYSFQVRIAITKNQTVYFRGAEANSKWWLVGQSTAMGHLGFFDLKMMYFEGKMWVGQNGQL